METNSSKRNMGLKKQNAIQLSMSDKPTKATAKRFSSTIKILLRVMLCSILNKIVLDYADSPHAMGIVSALL